jgi:hypothetical protein
MPLTGDLIQEVKNFFRNFLARERWQKVPEAEDIRLGNDAVKLQANCSRQDVPYLRH